MPYVEVSPGVNVYVEDWGSGKPIFFIHGWPLSHKMFEYQFTQLPEHGYRCVGIDLRGYGKSDRPWGDYTYNVFADDVKRVLEALDLRDVTMAGFSMGGAIAMRYMGRHFGERVAKLALLGAAAPCFTQRDDFPHNLPKSAVDGFIQACYADRAQLLVDFGKIFFLAEDSVSPTLGDWFHSLGMEASSHATAMSLIELRDADCRDDMAKIVVPTGIFHGTQDKICSFELAEVMSRGIPGSRIIRFEQSGHGLVVDETEKFNQELMSFVG